MSVLTSGIYPCVVQKKSSIILGEHVTSIFRVEEQAKQKTGTKQTVSRALLAPSFILKMEACSSIMSDEFHWTTWHYIPEDRTFHKLTFIVRSAPIDSDEYGCRSQSAPICAAGHLNSANGTRARKILNI
jgi:hypothetical protein